MKTVLWILVLTLGWLVSSGQFTKKEILYGSVQTDGYQQITKGAFWKQRPEAKIIYEGGKPPKGFMGYELASFSFLRFIEGENNGKDNNYIVAPPGARIYTDSIGQFYSAECGNKIEYIGPVERFILMPPTPTPTPTPTSKSDSIKSVSSVSNITNNTVNNYYTQKDTTLNESLLKLGTEKEPKTFFETDVGKGLLGAVLLTATGVGVKYLFSNKKAQPIIVVQPPVVIPPIVIPPVVIPPIVIPPIVIPPIVIPPPPPPPPPPPVVEPRTMPDGIPVEPPPSMPPGLPGVEPTMPPGIPATPETPTPETPSTPGLGAEPRGMPSGISQTFFPAGRMITVGVTFPAPWGR